MSIQKLVITKEPLPYTTILNDVLQNLRDATALGIWCYLSSLPDSWVVMKIQLQKHFEIGRIKLTKILQNLEEHKLLTITLIRDEKGRFSHLHIHVLNGSDFIAQKGVKEKSNENKYLTPLVQNQSPVNSTYKYNNNKYNNKNSCASTDARLEENKQEDKKEEQSFDQFWDIYPRKKDKKKTKKSWDRIPKPERALILEKLPIQIEKDSQWRNKQYIPYPSTYLNGHRWEDEVVTFEEIVKPSANLTPSVQNRSTVPDWGPGHPSYDSVHA